MSNRFFKNLGVLTTQLTNTWNPKTRSTPTRFNPHSPWRVCIQELEKNPPTYILIALNERMTRFRALKSFLRTHYQEMSYTQMKLKYKRPLFKLYQLKSHSKG